MDSGGFLRIVEVLGRCQRFSGRNESLARSGAGCGAGLVRTVAPSGACPLPGRFPASPASVGPSPRFHVPGAGSMVRTSRVLAVGCDFPRGAMSPGSGRRGSSSGRLAGPSRFRILGPHCCMSNRRGEFAWRGCSSCRGPPAEGDVFLVGIGARGIPRGSALCRRLHPSCSRPRVVLAEVLRVEIDDDRGFAHGVHLGTGWSASNAAGWRPIFPTSCRSHVGARPGVDRNARYASWTERGLHFDPRTLQVVLFGGMGLIRSRYEHQLTTGSSSRTSRGSLRALAELLPAVDALRTSWHGMGVRVWELAGAGATGPWFCPTCPFWRGSPRRRE